MASTHKSLRSGTANKRPTTSIADGQIALNTNVASPGLYFKDSTGASIIKIGPVHVGTTAPNVAPAGSAGNSTGEAWLDTSLTPNGWKVWTGAAWVNATPVGSATVQGLLELATDAETQAGSDTARAVTPAGLQSKVSDSTSTTSSTTIASSTAVKSAYDLANAALPKSGGTVTGNLEIGTSGSLTFEGATADAFETTLAVVDPTADRTITLPNVTGTVVTTGDTGTVTSTMILDGTILNADVNASAAIAGTKISPDFGSQNAVTTGTSTAASFIPTSSTVPTNGVYLPAANNVAISTGGSGRLFVDASGNVGVGVASPNFSVSIYGATNSYSQYINALSGSTGSDGFLVGLDEAGSAVLRYRESGSLIFYTSDAERMRLDSSGRLGVGTSSPGVPLHIYHATTNGVARFESGDATSLIQFKDSGTTLTPPSVGAVSNRLVIQTNDTEALTVDSSQRVGIGTSSLRQVAGATANVQAERTGAGGGAALSLLTNSSSGVPASLSLGASRGAAGTPTSVLSTDIVGSVNFFGADGTDYDKTVASIRARAIGTIATDRVPGQLEFYTAENNTGSTLTQRLTIDNTGRVGIGTTSPEGKLEVSAGNAEGLRLSSPSYLSTSQGPWIAFNGGPSAGWDLARVQGIRRGGNAEGALVFYTNNGGGAPGTISEKARIDETGRLLVGTSSAFGSGVNQVATTGQDAIDIGSFGTTPSYGGRLTFYRSKNATVGSATAVANDDSLGRIDFRGYGVNNYLLGARIDAFVDGEPSTGGDTTDMPGRLVFSTTADGASSPTERLRIDSSGRVGIGTTTPSQLLHCERTTAGVTALFGVNDGTFNPRLVVYGGSTGTTIQNTWSSSASNLIFANGGAVGSGTEAMRIDSSGRLGIGTSSPSALLDVAGATNPAIKITGSSTGSGSITYVTSSNIFNIASNNDSNSTYRPLSLSAFSLSFGTGSGQSITTAVTIDSAQRVGIGTTSPGAIFQTRVAADKNIAFNLDSNSEARISSFNDAISASAPLGFNGTDLRFQTGNTERARIDSSGRLLVGTSTSAGGDALQQISGVGSSTRPKLQLFHWEAGDGAAQLIFSKSRGSSFGSYTVVNSGDELGGLFFQGSNGSAFGTGARIDAVVDSAWGSGDYPTRLVFSTTAGGASSPTEAFRINSFQKPIFGGPTIRCLATYNSTTASAANQFVDSAGDFYRSTSSIKYKTNVETIEDHYSDALLQCHPVWYQSTCEADNPDWGHWGFIAEEVAQIDPRLCFFKEEEDGSLEPEGVQYDRFVPHLLNLIKRQKEQIEAMEARLSALEAQ
jgi:hypothetical protein